MKSSALFGWVARGVACAGAVALLLASPGQAAVVAPTTLTMDDLPTQPVDGLVHPAGVTFAFTVADVASVDAEFNSEGPGEIASIQDPSIEGTAAGDLAWTFGQPTPLVQFGVALSIGEEVLDGATIKLYADDGDLLVMTPFDLLLLDEFAEAQYRYTGTPVKSAALSFTTTAVFRFAFDNLAFTTVPEPAAGGLLVAAVTMAGWIRANRRRDAAPA